MADDRDLVFVSYSHVDAEWAEAVRILVEPALAGTGVGLWVDRANLRAGDVWPEEIERAIERSLVAVLLVTKEFLASAFIREHELPALRAHGVTLAPVLVGDCLWQRAQPGLTRVQWLEDPHPDNALSLYSREPGERDRRLTRAARQLLDLLPEPEPEPEPEPMPAPPSEPPVRADATPGPLFGVPELPDSYVERADTLAELAAIVVAQDAAGRTGSALGLHGRGGIGKSVLAAALARDRAVRAAFPDGVFWVTVGEHPDLLGVQLDLLRHLGTDDRDLPRTPDAARATLAALLADRHVLLVVDDVWTADAAEALRISGPRGQVLFTTREPGVLDGVGARRCPIDVLSRDEAARLAGRIVDRPPARLPMAAAHAFAQVGFVALAVSVLAATVRGGVGWDELVTALRDRADVYGSHPDADAFTAMLVANSELPAEVTERLAALRAFPEDETVPVTAVARLWAATHGDDLADTRRTLDRLAEAALLGVHDDGVALHDVQHAYAVLRGGNPADAHAAVLAGYRPLLGADGAWASLPADEPYIWNHVIRHLRGAGYWDELERTVTDPAFLGRRIEMGGPRAAEVDLARAAHARQDHPGIRWWRDWIPRHAVYLAQARGGGGCAVAPTLRAWLEATKTGPADPARLDAVAPATRLTVRWGLTAAPSALVRTLPVRSGRTTRPAWSPDGRHLAVASEHALLIVDLDGVVVATLAADRHPGRPHWSPDGNRITAIDARRARCWDARSGALVAEVGIARATLLAAWSADGRFLAVGTHIDGAVVVSEPGAGGDTTTIVVGAALEHLSWSPDGRILTIVAGRTDPVRLWNPRTGERLIAPPSAFTARLKVGWPLLAWSPDGTRLAGASLDGDELLIWHCTDATVHTVPIDEGIADVVWSPDGTGIAVLNGQDLLVLVDPSGRRVDGAVHTDGSRWPAWSPDGRWIATSGGAGEIRLWDVGLIGPEHPTTGVAAHDVRWAPVGRTLSVTHDARLDLHDARTGAVVASSPGRSGAWSPDGTLIAVLDTGGHPAGQQRTPLTLWNPWTGTRRAIPARGGFEPEFAAWSADGAWVAAWGHAEVHLIDPHYRTSRTLGVRPARALTGGYLVVWSPAGRRLAVLTSEGLRVWEPPVAGPTATLPIRAGFSCRDLSWSPDGNRILLVGTFVQEWVVDGRSADTVPVTGSLMMTARSSPDGRRLAGLVIDVGPVVIDRTRGAEIRLDGAPTDPSSSIRWSPDGSRLAVGGPDGRLQIWASDGRRFVLSTQLALPPVHTLDWSPAGLAVGGPWGAAVLDLHDAGGGTPNDPPTTELP